MDIDIVVIRTSGDILKDAPLAKIGGKGLFIKEIEEALLAVAVDLAVHSMKDLPAELPEGLQIAAVPTREDPRDVLISGSSREVASLPEGVNFGQIFGTAMLAGVGFTMSMFIANLAFSNAAVLMDSAKIGIMAGSLVSGIGGYIMLRFFCKKNGEGITS